MSPLPGWQVIPDGWAEAHRPVVEQTLQSPATVYRISDGPAPYPIPPGWSGSTIVWDNFNARVQEKSQRAGDIVVGDQPITQRQYLVVCPVGGPKLRAGERGDVVHVIGRELRIIDILGGTYEWELDLVCVENLTQENPS
ncbi:DUF6093 family protein [Arthrobacter cryoconiti]|uniref:DUF6093 family protein n=1 Tax=Arthrobacter cryoconiti TaxID=748907 RepID=A0ABV8QWL4_9MICC|nr:DUF6093 family protein [Arthrobacter cryoconiti]MCC9068801.1 DUF6093 family protein [Arthrobacter cryoconiti]